MKPDNRARDSKIFLAVMSGIKSKDVAKEFGISSSRITSIVQKKGSQIRYYVHNSINQYDKYLEIKVFFKGNYGCHYIKDYLKNGSKWTELHHKYYTLEGEVS